MLYLKTILGLNPTHFKYQAVNLSLRGTTCCDLCCLCLKITYFSIGNQTSWTMKPLKDMHYMLCFHLESVLGRPVKERLCTMGMTLHVENKYSIYQIFLKIEVLSLNSLL